MIVEELINPKSIAVIGASNDISKPGGRILKNIIEGSYKGHLYASNPKELIVQGVTSYQKVEELPPTDLAIFAIASHHIPSAMEILAYQKGTKAFIILSAGFSEVGPEGKALEEKVTKIVSSVSGSLIGPNCIGVLTTNYAGIFAGPIPKLDPQGCDFVTGSGATAAFVLETSIQMGISFASLFSVGNSAQIGVEDVLQYWDENFVQGKSPKVKLIYIEQVSKPELFLKHSTSLIQKGCSITAIKAGTTDAGSRAVSSHTGALAGSDLAVDALFRKAGIVRCYGREELAYVAGILQYGKPKGNRIAVVTHAGGPGVMLTDVLSKEGLQVPHIEGKEADELKAKLFPGSSVANPIDFLATGNAEQLGYILDFIENHCDNIDAAAVIFGTPGLFDVSPVYDVLHEKMNKSTKKIYPILPSIILAKSTIDPVALSMFKNIDSIEHIIKGAIDKFVEKGRSYFPDEVQFGKMLGKVMKTSSKYDTPTFYNINVKDIRQIIDNYNNGYLKPTEVQSLLDIAGIPRVQEFIANNKVEAIDFAYALGFPLAMKVVGPIHKTEVEGVKLNIQSINETIETFNRLMKIEGAEAVLMQKMLKEGFELFVGAKREENFGHIILCGMGGIYIELFKDIAYCLAPCSNSEAENMIKSLKSYKLFEGYRGKKGINFDKFKEVILRLSSLLHFAPEIYEIDINPLFGSQDSIFAVDARINISKKN